MKVANRLVCFEINHNQDNYALKVIDATKIVFEVSKLRGNCLKRLLSWIPQSRILAFPKASENLTEK